MGIKLKKKWLATMDNRTRASHVQLDGEAVGVDDAFSNGLKYPGDPVGHPAEVYNCRCTLITEIEDVDTSNAPRNSKLGDMTWEEWKRSKSG